MDCPDGDVEPRGDLGRRELPARLEQQKQRDKPCGPHSLKMTEDVLFVCDCPGMNIWDDAWDDDEDWSGGGSKSRRLVPRGPFLGATVYELDPGNWVIYHAHHGSDELLFVLRGRPTLRTPEGERQLDEGEVVSFPPGPQGAHGLRNDTDETRSLRRRRHARLAGGRRVPRPEAAHSAVAPRLDVGRAAVRDPRREGGGMTEREEIGGTVIEFLLREPEIVAWLEPRAGRRRVPDDEPPRAA